MPNIMRARGFLRVLLRGALGGALGGFLWVIIAVLTTIGFRRGWWYWLIIGYLSQGLPLGVIFGAFVACTFWLFGRLTDLHLGIIRRFLTGSLIATMIAWTAAWWFTQPGDFFPTPWHLDFVWLILFGTSTGGIGGMIAGNQRVSGRGSSGSNLI